MILVVIALINKANLMLTNFKYNSQLKHISNVLF
jgi:hypothetical protein